MADRHNQMGSELHRATKDLIEWSKRFSKPIIIFEGLSKMNPSQIESKTFRKKVARWIRGRLQKLSEYKARWEGVPVLYVSPWNTSKQCSRCGGMGERSGLIFKCNKCGYSDYADRNTCYNIAIRGYVRATKCDCYEYD